MSVVSQGVVFYECGFTGLVFWECGFTGVVFCERGLMGVKLYKWSHGDGLW